ncbi:MAG TPA: DUF4328 domain-containing protein [Acidimicrobiales bacterium]|nr:DUF4328 domain-containing protein [Acidimicrobiales bacterium]
MSYEPPGGTPPPPPPWQPPPPASSAPPPPGAPYPPAAYGVGAYAYTPTQSTQSTKGLSTALVILLAITSLTGIFVAIAFFHRASLVDDTNRVFFNLKEVSDADDQVSAAVAIFMLGLLATGVVWIIWQFRYSKNAELLRGNFGLPSGWAIGGWFVPIGNFALPQLQLLQAARASDPDLPQGQPVAAGRPPSTLVPWWVLYDLAWLFFFVGRGTRPDNNELVSLSELDKFVRADRISGVAALVFLAAGVVAIFLVRSCTDRQSRALASFTPQAPPPSPQWQPPPPVPPQQQWSPPPPPAQWQPPPAPPPPQQWPPPAPPPPAPPPPAPPPPAPAPPQQWPPPPPPPPQ